MRRGPAPEAVGSTRGARGGTAGSCHLHTEVGTVHPGWQGAPASRWLQGSRLLPIPGLEEVLGEDQQPTEVSRGGRLLQGTVEGCSCSKVLGGDGGKSTTACSRESACRAWRREVWTQLCVQPDSPALPPPGLGAPRAHPGPSQPSQKRPGAPLLSQARVAAGCRLLQRDRQADYQCPCLKGKMEQPRLPLRLL